MKQTLIILLPASARERFSEDGVLEALKERFDCITVEYFHCCSWKQLTEHLDYLCGYNPSELWYTSFDSELFWNPIFATEWFLDDSQKTKNTPDAEQFVGISEFIEALERKGVPCKAVKMYYGGPFEDELTLPASQLVTTK